MHDTVTKKGFVGNSSLYSTVLSVYQQAIASRDVLKCAVQGSAKLEGKGVQLRKRKSKTSALKSICEAGFLVVMRKAKL